MGHGCVIGAHLRRFYRICAWRGVLEPLVAEIFLPVPFRRFHFSLLLEHRRFHFPVPPHLGVLVREEFYKVVHRFFARSARLWSRWHGLRDSLQWSWSRCGFR